MKITLHFDLTLNKVNNNIEKKDIDEFGKEIAYNLLQEMINGEDDFDWRYTGCDLE